LPICMMGKATKNSADPSPTNEGRTRELADIGRIIHVRAETAIEAAGGDFTVRIVWIGAGSLVYYGCKLAIVAALGALVLANCAAFPFERSEIDAQTGPPSSSNGT